MKQWPLGLLLVAALFPEKAHIINRRSVLTGLALVGAAPLVMSQTQPLMAATMPVTMADIAKIKAADQFYVTVIGRAELSLATSQIAVEKAKQKNAHEFAGFELGEAITVNMVLKDIGAKAPAMEVADNAKVEQIKMAAAGREFDEAYISFQLENHEFLRDLADSYLHNTAGATSPEEKQGRHLAMLMHAVFGEHVAICKRIAGELKA